MKEPDELPRLRGSSGRPEHYRSLDPRLGTWARALAAAKPGAALLHLCEWSDEMALWIRSGMDLGSRLVVVSPEAEGTKALERVMGFDLRITCHCQAPDAFLEDVRSHRFGLIVHDGVPKERRTYRSSLGRALPRRTAPGVRAGSRIGNGRDPDRRRPIFRARRRRGGAPCRHGGRPACGTPDACAVSHSSRRSAGTARTGCGKRPQTSRLIRIQADHGGGPRPAVAQGTSQQPPPLPQRGASGVMPAPTEALAMQRGTGP